MTTFPRLWQRQLGELPKREDPFIGLLETHAKAMKFNNDYRRESEQHILALRRRLQELDSTAPNEYDANAWNEYLV